MKKKGYKNMAFGGLIGGAMGGLLGGARRPMMQRPSMPALNPFAGGVIGPYQRPIISAPRMPMPSRVPVAPQPPVQSAVSVASTLGGMGYQPGVSKGIGMPGNGFAGGMLPRDLQMNNATPMAKGGKVPGKAQVGRDSIKNDVIPALLSPGEIVVPRSKAGNKKSAKKFIDKVLKRKGKKGK